MTQTRKIKDLALNLLFLKILAIPLVLGAPNYHFCKQQYSFPTHWGSKSQRCLWNLLLYLPPSNHLQGPTDSLAMCYRQILDWQQLQQSHQVSPLVQMRKLRLRELSISTMKLLFLLLPLYAVVCGTERSPMNDLSPYLIHSATTLIS